MKQGVSLLAIGSSAYGGWAVNFAVSLKYHSPEVSIQLICDEANLIDTAQYHHLFEIITKIDPLDCTDANGDFFPAKAKLNLYKYFAYDQTAYFDVDAVVIKDILPLFELNGNIYTDVQGVHTIQQGNFFDHLKWAKPETIWQHFKLPITAKLPAVNSSFVLIHKCEPTKKVWDLALKLLLENKLPTEQYWHKWGRGKGRDADELYFNVACAMLNIIPEHLVAVYFRTIRETGMAIPLIELEKKHYAIGLFGDARSLHLSSKEYYNKLMMKYWKQVIGTTFYNKAENLLKGKIVSVRT